MKIFLLKMTTALLTVLILSGNVAIAIRTAPVSAIGSRSICPSTNGVMIPITVAGFTNVTSVSLRVELNSAVMTYIAGSAIVNSAINGMLVNVPTGSPYRIMIVWSDVVPRTLATNDTLVKLFFNYTSGATTLAFNNTSNGGGDCEFTDELGDPMTDTPTATYYINGNSTSSGVGPAGPVTGTASLCAGTNGIAYSVPAVTNATGYAWSLPSGFSVTSGNNTSSIMVNVSAAAASGSISVTPSNTCGSGSASAAFPVTVNPVPVPTLTGPATVCIGATGNVYLTESGKVNYLWSISGGTITSGGGSGNNTAIVTWTAAGTKLVSVNYATSAGCMATSATFQNVTVIALPVPTITGPVASCTATTETYSTESGMTGYTWAVSSGGSVTSGSGTNSINVLWNTAGSQTVAVNYANADLCTAASPTSKSVTVNARPTPSITGMTIVCAGATGVIYTTEPSMTGYQWTVSSGGTITAGTGTNLITVTWTTAGAKTVTVNYSNTNSCIAAGASSKSVSVTALPVPTISGMTSLCAGTTGVTYTTEPGMTNYTWTVSSGGTITAGAGTNVITVTWNTVGVQSVSVNYTNSNSCSAATATSKSLMVYALPVPTITGSLTACTGTSAISYVTESGMTGYLWTVSSGGTISSGQGTGGINVNWSTTGLKTITVTYTNPNGCSPVNPTSLSVTVNTIPAQPGPVTGTHDVVVGQTAVLFSVPPVATATGYNWTLPPGATISSGSNTNSITVNFPPAIQSGNISVMATNGCGNSISSVNYAVTMHKYAPKTMAASVNATAGASVTIPVMTKDFNLITGISLRLDYNPARAYYTGNSGIQTALNGILINDVAVSPTLHKVMITWSNYTPVTLIDSSVMFNLIFNYVSDTTHLVWNTTSNGGADCEYADEQGNYTVDSPPANYYFDGLIKPGLNITGQFTYNNAVVTPMDLVWVILKQNGTPVDSTQANVTGNYTFSGKAPGLYTIDGHSHKPWSGVNATDAVKIQRHFAGLELLTVPVRLQAADVNFSNTINATDAVKLNRRFTGLDSTFARGNWTFAKPSGGDTVILTTANVTQDFQSLCVGDVNGSNTPAVGAKSTLGLFLNSSSIQLFRAGEVIEVKLRTDEAASLGAFSVVLGYPASKMTILSVTCPQGNLISNILPNQVRLAWSELEPFVLNKGDDLATLKLIMKEDVRPDEEVGFTLGNESELADGSGEVVDGVGLRLPRLKSAPGNGSAMDADMVSSLQIYPNPANEQLTVAFNLDHASGMNMKIIDPLGRVVYSAAGGLDKGKVNRQIDLSGLNPGCYFLEIACRSMTGACRKVLKVVKL